MDEIDQNMEGYSVFIELEAFLSSGWGIAVSGVVIFSSITKFFWGIDGYFSEELREDIALRLLCLEPKRIEPSVTRSFIRMFDTVFVGNTKKSGLARYLSLTCFGRSTIASYIAVMVVVVIGVSTNSLTDFFRAGPLVDVLLLVMLVSAVLNIIPDYVSLLETRFAIYVLERSKPRYWIFILLVDLFVTLATFLLVAVPLISFTALWNPDARLSDFLEVVLWRSDATSSIYPVLGVFVYSTFLTSVWLWAFLIADAAIRLSSRAGAVLDLLKKILPIEKSPFRSIGIVAAGILTICYWVFAIGSSFAVLPSVGTQNPYGKLTNLQSICGEDSANECLKLAKVYSGSISQSFIDLGNLCKQNNAGACLGIGLLQLHSDDADEVPSLIAAQKSFVQACALEAEHGCLVLNETNQYLEHACAKGYREACLYLGDYYFEQASDGEDYDDPIFIGRFYSAACLLAKPEEIDPASCNRACTLIGEHCE